MGTTEGNTTHDLQGGRKIDHQLRCTCLESKMSSIDHLHTEVEMLKVMEHSELLSAQYLARCLEPENVCHSIQNKGHPKRQMNETLYTD